MAVGGGGRATSESFWPDPPQRIAALRRRISSKMAPGPVGAKMNKVATKKAGMQKKAIGTAATGKSTGTGFSSRTVLPLLAASKTSKAIVDKRTARAAWGTAGRWMGRRPPKDAAKLAIFLAKKAAWEAQKQTQKQKKLS